MSKDYTRTSTARRNAIESRRERAHKHGHTVTNGSGRVRSGTAYNFTVRAGV